MIDRELERACAIVAHKDTQPLRRALFAQLTSRSAALRATLAAWDRLGTGRRAAAYVGALSLARFLEVRVGEADADLLAACRYDNERRQVAKLAALAPSLRIEHVELGAPITTLAPVLRLGRVGLGASTARIGSNVATPASEERAAGEREWTQAWALLRRYSARGDFLVAARVAETVGYYLRMRPHLAEHRAPAVLVSSDTNPYAVALVAAARRLGKRTCFVAHGHVADGPPPLDFDLSLLDGPAQRAVYERAGPIRGEVVYRGAEGVTRPMRTAGLRRGVRTLGVVLSILVDWRRVGDRLERLRAALRPDRVVLRLHPNREMRDPRWANALRLEGVEVSLGERPLTDDVAGCDLVVAGNTSAHLTVLALGVPTLYLPDLDEVGADYYGFVREGIVATAQSNPEAIDWEAIAGFYDHPEWPARFARFDAGYPDRQDACDREVAAALRALVSGSPAAARSEASS